MSLIYEDVAAVKNSVYKDRMFSGSDEEYVQVLKGSTTLYIGNLSFYTSEEQIHELFSSCGLVKKIIMGLDKMKKTPCGFCFVEYYTRTDAERAVRYVNKTKLDDRPIRVDWDWGFKEGRQYGRGKNGGQVREDYRTVYDPARGKYGDAGMHQGSSGHRDRSQHRSDSGRKRGREDMENSGRGGGSAERQPGSASKNPRFREERNEEEED